MLLEVFQFTGSNNKGSSANKRQQTNRLLGIAFDNGFNDMSNSNVDVFFSV